MAAKISDVAVHAKVSEGTVSNVINALPSVRQEIRERVLKSIRELGYVPNDAAHRLKMKKIPGKTGNIGCVSFAEVSEHSKLVPYGEWEGVNRQTVKEGYHLFFTYSVEQLINNIPLYSKVVNPDNVDGIILLGPRQKDEEFYKGIIKRIKCVVCLFSDLPNIDIDNFCSEVKLAGYKAVKYFFELGHRRIGFAGDIVHHTEWFEGYCKALRELGLKYDESIVEGEAYGFEEEHGYRYMSKILERANPLPTAVFAACDLTAFGVMKAIKARGLRIPEDISVIGYNDIEETKYVSPPLTTFRAEVEELGRMAVRRLIERIKNPDIAPVTVVVPVKLVIRESCRRIE